MQPVWSSITHTNRGLAWSVVQLLDAYARAGRPRPLVMVQWEIAQDVG